MNGFRAKWRECLMKFQYIWNGFDDKLVFLRTVSLSDMARMQLSGTVFHNRWLYSISAILTLIITDKTWLFMTKMNCV
jgi:hypothetical protein